MADDRSNAWWIRIRATIRWLVAGGVGVTITIALFVVMAAALSGVDIVGRMFRIFPLTRTAVVGSDECADGGIAAHLAVPIEGVVGYLRNDQVIPLFDADLIGDNAVTGETPVEVAKDGSFRFIAAFPNPDPAACRESEPLKDGAAQRLTVRARGCTERIVPVTAAWVPHAILLDCAVRD